jgi:parallel beta-helix repeat protein
MQRLLGFLSVVCLLSTLSNAQTISVTPANVRQVVVPSNRGATFSFAAGAYTFSTNPTGPAADWSSVPGTFVGNGAVFALSTGVSPNSSQELVKFAPGSSVSGFVFTDAQIHCEGGTFSVTGNTFQNTYRGIFVAFNSGHFDNNTINQCAQEGIYGYPGSNCTYSSNVITNTGNDAIHLVGSPDSVTLDGNVIANCGRIGIELQNAFTNLAVTNNYVEIIQPSAPNSFMAYSIATGSGNNITVSNNTGVSSRVGAGACFEIMGTNATISSNLSWGFGQFILNGGQGTTVNSSNNVTYGGVFSANDSTSWKIATLVSAGDTNPPLPVSAMPSPPAAPAVVPAPVGGGNSGSTGSSTNSGTGTGTTPGTPTGTSGNGTSSGGTSGTTGSAGTGTSGTTNPPPAVPPQSHHERSHHHHDD